MKLLPIHIRMCLMFLFRREKEFTEADMTPQELQDLHAYARREKLQKKAFRRIYLAFGKIRVTENVITDVYNFEPVAYNSLLNALINILYLHHMFGYKGYKIKVELGATVAI